MSYGISEIICPCHLDVSHWYQAGVQRQLVLDVANKNSPIQTLLIISLYQKEHAQLVD
jgi:hypothetical protein